MGSVHIVILKRHMRWCEGEANNLLAFFFVIKYMPLLSRPWGSGSPPPLFGGPLGPHKEGGNVLVVNSYLDTPLSEILSPPVPNPLPT